MTRKDLFNEWERQEPLELDKEKLGTAFSKVLKKIDSVESVMENEKAHRKSGSYVFRKVAIYSSVAAAAVICVTLAFTSVSKKANNRGLYAHIQEMPVNMTEYSTSNGEIRRVTLPDSSKVILNAGSVLICPERFGAGGREVYLSGEAVFDVTGDTDGLSLSRPQTSTSRCTGPDSTYLPTVTAVWSARPCAGAASRP